MNVLTLPALGMYGGVFGRISSKPKCHNGITSGVIFDSDIKRPTPVISKILINLETKLPIIEVLQKLTYLYNEMG